jgi:hypothetical protein
VYQYIRGARTVEERALIEFLDNFFPDRRKRRRGGWK